MESLPVWSQRLKELRGKRTQRKMCEISGVSTSTWSRWEAGESEPSIEEVISLCGIFNMYSDWLFGLSDERLPCLQAVEAQGGGCPSCQKKDETIFSLVKVVEQQQETVAGQQNTINRITCQSEKKTTSQEGSSPSSGAKRGKATA